MPPCGNLPCSSAFCCASCFRTINAADAPLNRNEPIVAHSDLVLAFGDGKSRGTQHVIRCCRERRVACRVYLQQGREFVLRPDPIEKQTPLC